ncbi:MAG TPA: type II toxin-antitoxin system Phd/YefM family antitoxin [Magnetospirillaceae bacterium]|jgi:prevent-host-death family protein
MKLTNQVRPISYLKAHAPEIIEGLAEGGAPVIITQRGEAKAVLQDLASYEATQETLALLKILALGEKDVAEGNLIPAREAFARIRKEIKGKKKR